MKKIAMIIAMALVASLSGILPASASKMLYSNLSYVDVDQCKDTHGVWQNFDFVEYSESEGVTYKTASGVTLQPGKTFTRDLGVTESGGVQYLRIYVYPHEGYTYDSYYDSDEVGNYFILDFPNNAKNNDSCSRYDPPFDPKDREMTPESPVKVGNSIQIPSVYGLYYYVLDSEGYYSHEYSHYDEDPVEYLSLGQTKNICVYPDTDLGFTLADNIISDFTSRYGHPCWRFSSPHPNVFSLPTGSHNTKKATISLPIKVRTSGKVKLSGGGVKTTTKSVGSSGKVTVTVKPTSKTYKAMKKALKKKKVVTKSVKIKATYYPKSGPSYTVYKTYKLILKRKR